jgi:TRAP-type C4-dicarboxylate transport system permease small subunit
MGVLKAVLVPFQIWNDFVLKIGRGIAIVAMAAMVIAILVQVFFRYILNNALPWPEEAARFMMLWMTGLIAPTAYRRGGFVAIDMLALALPARLGALLTLVLLLIAGSVLFVSIGIGWKEVTGFGGRFASEALWIPLSPDFETWYRLPRSWMMSSLLVGVVLLFIVNVELILRSLIALMGGADDLRPIPAAPDEIMAE